MAPSQRLGKPSPALQVDHDLLDSILDRSIQLGDRGSAHHCVRVNAVPSLKAAHGVVHTLVKKLGVGNVECGSSEVTGGRKACTQQRDPWTAVTEPQGRPFPDRCPRLDSAVPRQSLLQEPVTRLRRLQRAQSPGDVARSKGPFKGRGHVAAARGRDPFWINGVRVDVTAQHVRAVQDERIGEEQLQISKVCVPVDVSSH